ncbi:ead/Ea22-like family protein [Salmonella enterica]|nr:ead/Ea22-like family protein [Salmonella enterica]HAO4184371.1 ead/Ea22-like family protein [Salmonella enterica]
MSNIDKQALREEFRNMQDHYSDPADRERQEIYIAAEALLDENIQLQREKDAIEAVALALRDDMRQAREQLEEAERRVAELDQRLIEYAGIATREARRVAELEDENEYVRWRFKESDLLFAMLLITMRAAVIEKEHGEGDRAAMDWIINKLAGPGEFAPESETDAQAYFNRESEIIDSEFSACMDFFMKRNERLRAAGIKVKGE